MPSRTNTSRDRSWLFRFFAKRTPVFPRSCTSHSIEALESRIAPASLASVATTKASGAAATDEGAIAAQVGAPIVTVTAGPSVAEDGNGTITFIFTRQGPSTVPLTASFNVTGAATSSDYTLTGTDLTAFNPATGAGAVTFATGSSTATVVVNPIDDSTVEPDEQVTFNVLAGTGGYVVGTPGSDTAFILNDDTDVRIIVSPGSISEDGGGSLLYTLVRSGVTSTSLTVNFSLSGLAVPGTDYDVLNATSFSPSKGVGTVTFLPESVTTSFSINPKADNVQEADETAIVTVTNGAGYNVVGPGAAGLITNDDSTVTVAVNPGAVAEDGKTDLVYTFTRTGYTGNILTVDFSVGGTASFGGPGADYSQLGAQTYTATAGTATFVDGASTTTVTIHPLADTTAEADETVILTLANSGGSSTGGYTSVPPNTATGTIVNDDAAVSVAIGSTPVLESSTTGLVYTFTRTGDSSVPLTINFTSSGTAAFGADFAAVSSGTLNFAAHTLIIPAGSASATVTLTPIDDRSVEGTETAILGVATGSGYVVSGSPATGSITDNDTATIGYASTTSSVLESAANDLLSLVLTINGTGTGTPTLERDVTFNVTTAAGGTATGGGTDYSLPSLLTFPAGSINNASQTANLAIFNDALVEGTETANLGLALGIDGTAGQVTIAAGAASAHTSSIGDNDFATIGFNSATSSVLESANNDPLGIVLTINANGTGPASLARAITFNVTATGGTATAADFVAPALLSFPAGTPAGNLLTANLGIVDDMLVEGIETVNSGLAIVTDSTGGQISIATGGPAAHATTIVDNDTAVFEFVNPTGTISEATAANSVAVKMTINAIGTGAPALARAVSLNLTSAGGTALGGGVDFTLPTASLTFAQAALDGATQSATVGITNDTLIEGPETAIFGLVIATDGTGGRTAIGTQNIHTATINDNDTATISFAATTSNAPEGTSPHTFDVKLVTTANGVVGAGTLAGPVSVNVSVPSGVAGGTATGGGIDYTFPATFNVAFAAGSADSTKAVPVSITNDQLSEANETVNFTLSGSSNTIGSSLVIDPGTHAATIVDNDADLTISVTGSAGPVIAGSGPNNLAYTVKLTNSGKTDATNVIVGELFTLPAGVTFSGATPGAGVFDSTTGTWTVAAVAGNGGIATLNLNFTADHSTANSATATITASATSADQALVNTSDDTANASVAIARQGDLSVVVTDSPDPAGPLQQLTYTIVVSNTGPSDSSGAILRDTFPATFRTVTWTALFPNGGAGSTSGSGDINEILSLPAGGNAVYTVTGTIAALAANSALSNTATISGPRAQDLNPANDSATEQTAISGIDLQLTEDDSLTSVQPGDVIKYTLSYLNAAFVTATGAKITDLVPLNTVFDAADSTAGWTGVVDGSPAGTIARFDLGTLAAGTAPGSIVFAVRVTDTVTAGQSSIAHNATISDDGLHGLDRNSTNDSASDIDTLVAAPDFHILKTLNGVDVQTDGGLVARRGAAVTYTLTYSNEGNQDASGVVITQTLPANTFFAGGPDWTETSPGSGVYSYDAGTVAAKDGTHTVPFRVLVNSVLPNHLTELSTTASIDDGGINGLDPTLDDDSKTDTTPVYQGIYAVTPGVTVPKGFGPPTVLVFDAATGAKIASFLAYEPHIRASIRIAVGDFNDDGFDDIITSSAKGTGRIRVFLADSFTGTTFTQSGDEIAAFDGRKTIGAFIAVGDVNGDRQDDIIVGSALGSGRMKVFDGISHTPLLDLKPFGSSFTGGVRVAAGDVDGDGIADIIAGQGFEGGRVKVYQGENKFGETPALGSTILQDFYVGGQSYRGGVSVAAGDLNGDGRADIITGRNSYSKPLVQTFDGTTHSLLKSFLALPGSYANGIRVAAADVNLDGIADIIVGAGFDGGSQVKIFDGANDQALGSLSAYPTFPKMALWVAGTAEVPIANRRGD